MSIDKKKIELFNEIKNSREYNEYLEAKKNLSNSPDDKKLLEKYKSQLIERELGNLIVEQGSLVTNSDLEKTYDEISKSEIINEFLMAEYKIKNILTQILDSVTSIIDDSSIESIKII